MQLILDIDDIGIKKNMSSGEETNSSENKNKTEVIDSNLNPSLSPSGTPKVDQENGEIVEFSLVNITDKTNDIASCDDVSIDDENSSEVNNKCELENNKCLIRDIQEDSHDIKAVKIKTESEDNIRSEECPDEPQEKQLLVHKISELNGDENIDSNIRSPRKSKKSIETECQNENIYEKKFDLSVHTINRDSGKNEAIDKDVKESCEHEIASDRQQGNYLTYDAEIKQESCEYEKATEEIKDHNLADDDEIKQEPCEYENASEGVEANNLADDAEIKQESCESEKKCKEMEIEKSVHDAKMTNASSEYDNIHEKMEASTSSDNATETNSNEVSLSQDEQNSNDENISCVDENKTEKGSQIQTIDTNGTNNAISDNDENCKTEHNETSQHSNEKCSRDNSATCLVNDEVIDIADERDSEASIENEDEIIKNRDKPSHTNKEHDKQQSANNHQHKKKRPVTIYEDIIDIADEKDSCDSIEDNSDSKCNILRKTLESECLNKPIFTKHENISQKNSVSETQDCNETSSKAIGYSDSKLKKSESTDKVTGYKLSNTLDILSDEEEESSKSNLNTPKLNKEIEKNEKKSIMLEEDDDIMVIDDESFTKDENILTEKEKSDTVSPIPNKINENNIKDTTFKSELHIEKDLEESQKLNETKTELNKSEITKNAVTQNPLLSSTTLKSFKKNLGEMTRDELEDFCILTIAEAIFDRSNLGELKSQIKLLTQNYEEHKLKAKSLAKQNRDLQVVLKSIQEEQKKNSDAPITPLKITRSVGMQVLMTDKVSRKRQAMLSAQMIQNNSPTKQITSTTTKVQNKQAASPNASNTKTPPRQNQQQIPVPRLVPASITAPKPIPNTSPQVNNIKSPANVPNGAKATPSAAKPEKRTHTKMQQSSAVTVDLTDDEPPAKVTNRSFNSPVRCVPPQALLATRPSLPMTSPRKVYIPISGQQAQNIRPGQHIMLKSVTGIPGGLGRPRGPSPNMKTRIAQRHPAPLPELMKQYQPPNWKALPPAPELKLAKVENGIVISWKIDGYREENHEEIASYQLFAYQETSQPPNTSLWKKIGDVKALPLPMACTLTQFMSGYKYYFAVRAVDVKSRFGPFSLPGSILLLKN